MLVKGAKAQIIPFQHFKRSFIELTFLQKHYNRLSVVVPYHINSGYIIIYIFEMFLNLHVVSTNFSGLITFAHAIH